MSYHLVLMDFKMSDIYLFKNVLHIRIHICMARYVLIHEIVTVSNWFHICSYEYLICGNVMFLISTYIIFAYKNDCSTIIISNNVSAVRDWLTILSLVNFKLSWIFKLSQQITVYGS